MKGFNYFNYFSILFLAVALYSCATKKKNEQIFKSPSTSDQSTAIEHTKNTSTSNQSAAVEHTKNTSTSNQSTAVEHTKNTNYTDNLNNDALERSVSKPKKKNSTQSNAYGSIKDFKSSTENHISKFLYTMYFYVDSVKNKTQRTEIKGNNKKKIHLQVTVDSYPGIESELNELPFKSDYSVIKKKIYNTEFDSIKVVFSSDGGILFKDDNDGWKDKYIYSISIEKGIKGKNIVLEASTSIKIDEKYKNTTDEVNIKAELFMNGKNDKKNHEILVLKIIPLTFNEKLQGLFIELQDETIKKMNVLYTGLLGIIVTAFLAFVRKKLKVKEEEKPQP